LNNKNENRQAVYSLLQALRPPFLNIL